MDPVEAPPSCVNQILVRELSGRLEPTQICSCAAGLIHMHDCPVTLGLPCQHFHPGTASSGVTVQEAEQVHDRLMQDYLTRPYAHRVRSLSPAGNPWHRRREELYAFYATVELEGEAPEQDDEDYERERDRLIELRRQREEIRKEREERTREEKARERARLGIKTVVEKAQEAVATQGNVMSSVVDDLQLPEQQTRPRRRRRRRGPGRPGDAPGAAAGEGGAGAESPAAPRKRRRRRRRRGPRSGDGAPPSA